MYMLASIRSTHINHRSILKYIADDITQLSKRRPI